MAAQRVEKRVSNASGCKSGLDNTTKETPQGAKGECGGGVRLYSRTKRSSNARLRKTRVSSVPSSAGIEMNRNDSISKLVWYDHKDRVSFPAPPGRSRLQDIEATAPDDEWHGER
jgi:hypothetical protein